MTRQQSKLGACARKCKGRKGSGYRSCLKSCLGGRKPSKRRRRRRR